MDGNRSRLWKAKQRNFDKINGKKFGLLTVIGDCASDKWNGRRVICRCECGSEKEYNFNNISRRPNPSCGCINAQEQSKRRLTPFINLQNKRFGLLTIIEDYGTSKSGRMVLCKCDCGNEKIIRVASLKNGDTQSCGCATKMLFREKRIVHGLSKHPLHKVWYSMIERCYGEDYCLQYPNYGGNGVSVCDEWKNDFMAFYNWAIQNGWHKDLELDKDKLGTGKLYCPEYCCFLTSQENSWHRKNNKIVSYKGYLKCLAEWCAILRLPYKLTSQRIERNKWPIEKAFQYKEIPTYI